MGRIRRPSVRAGCGLASAACLLACLLGQAEALPDLLALGAWLEGSHAVHVARDAGKVHLVLRHEREFPGGVDFSLRHQPGQASHQHGLASGLLCVLAKSSSSRADHEVAFDNAIPSANAPSQITGGTALPKAALMPALARLASGARSHSPSLLPVETLARPSSVAVLRALRSTSLLL